MNWRKIKNLDLKGKQAKHIEIFTKILCAATVLPSLSGTSLESWTITPKFQSLDMEFAKKLTELISARALLHTACLPLGAGLAAGKLALWSLQQTLLSLMLLVNPRWQCYLCCCAILQQHKIHCCHLNFSSKGSLKLCFPSFPSSTSKSQSRCQWISHFVQNLNLAIPCKLLESFSSVSTRYVNHRRQPQRLDPDSDHDLRVVPTAPVLLGHWPGHLP